MVKESKVKVNQVVVCLIFLWIFLLVTAPVHNSGPVSMSEAMAGETGKSTGVESLVVSPAIADLGSTVEILGAGFAPGTKLHIYIAPEPVFGWKASTKTEAIMMRLKPEPMPVVNIGGGFCASFGTRGIKEAGIYCLEARTKEGTILASAPLKLTQKAKQKK